MCWTRERLYLQKREDGRTKERSGINYSSYSHWFSRGSSTDLYLFQAFYARFVVFRLVSCWLLGTLLNPEDRSSTFLTSVNFYQTTQGHIPEDSTLHSHSCETLISDMPYTVHKLQHIIFKAYSRTVSPRDDYGNKKVTRIKTEENKLVLKQTLWSSV
jgi:hypothetical protein